MRSCYAIDLSDIVTLYRNALTSLVLCSVLMEAWLPMLPISQSTSAQCRKLCNTRWNIIIFYSRFIWALLFHYISVSYIMSQHGVALFLDSHVRR